MFRFSKHDTCTCYLPDVNTYKPMNTKQGSIYPQTNTEKETVLLRNLRAQNKSHVSLDEYKKCGAVFPYVVCVLYLFPGLTWAFSEGTKLSPRLFMANLTAFQSLLQK